MARGVDAGTGRKEGTMCVHAAHVACQPAWQPGGLPSVSSSSLASKSEAPSFSPPLGRNLFLSLPPAPRPSSFSSLSEEEQCYERRRVSSFLSNCSLLPGALPPTAHLRLDGYYNRWATTENARRDFKAVSRNEIFLRDVEGLTD